MAKEALQKNWIAHFIFATPEGNVFSETKVIVAEDYEKAFHLAAKKAPAKDFILQVLPESDEQFLHHVQQQARKMMATHTAKETSKIPDISHQFKTDDSADDPTSD